jgi:cyclopropane-fatty-acyl-phospholipid synthase
MTLSWLASGAEDLYSMTTTFAHKHAIANARPAILSLLASIEVGTLTLVDQPHGESHGEPHGKHYIFGSSSNNNGQDSTNPHVTLTVTSPTFYPRLFFLSDMGFAQSYLLNEVTCSDLTSFFRLFILNRDKLSNSTTTTSWWSSMLTRAAGSLSSLLHTAQSTAKTNTASGAALNIAAHYDISNDMFAAFLSDDMTYSCPIWDACADPVWDRSSSTHHEKLKDAQMRKLRRFITGARIKAADHVLEIGTGWGSFAIEAVRRTGCRVTTLTLSREQKVWAEESIAREGLAGRIEVLLADYRDAAVPVPEGGYDKVVSIEMLEAVGRGFLGTYFARVDRLLKREGGVAMFQCITMPEGRHAAYERREE